MSHIRSRKELATSVEAGAFESSMIEAGMSGQRETAPARPSQLARLPQLPASRVGVRIVRAESNSGLFDAEAELAAAQAETRRLKVDITTATEQARDEGYAAGREMADQELAIELHRVQQQMAAWQSEARETIVDLAVKIATKLVGTFDVEETTRANIVNQTLKHLNDGPYTLQVASNMLGVARQAIRDLEADHPGVAVPALRLDARLPEGRAVLITRYGSIDLDLDAQLEAIRMSLLGRDGDGASSRS